MKRLFMLIGLALLVLPAYAQEATPETTPFVLPEPEMPFALPENAEPMLIQAVTLQDVKTVQLSVAEVLTDGNCGVANAKHIERQGLVLFVDKYHLASTKDCTMTNAELNMTLPELLMPDADDTLAQYMVMNDVYLGVAWAEGTDNAKPMLVGLKTLVRAELRVDTATLEARDDGFVYLLVTGWQTEACAAPVLHRVQPVLDAPDTYTVDIFRALDADIMCPLSYVPVAFEVAIKTPLAADATGVIQLKDITLPYPPEASATATP